MLAGKRDEDEPVFTSRSPWQEMLHIVVSSYGVRSGVHAVFNV